MIENVDGTITITSEEVFAAARLNEHLLGLGVRVKALRADPDCDSTVAYGDWGDLYPRIVLQDHRAPGVTIRPDAIPARPHAGVVGRAHSPSRPPAADRRTYDSCKRLGTRLRRRTRSAVFIADLPEDWLERSRTTAPTQLCGNDGRPRNLLIGHGLQKLVPPRYSPPLLHAMGHRATASGFEQLGIRTRLPAALLAGSAEILGGVSLGANAEGGFEFPLVLLALSFVIIAFGAGSYSVNAWAHVSNWAGIQWSMSHVARAGIVLAIGAGAGLLTVIGASAAKSAPARPSIPAAG
jgi:uncharacterized membrane protein YphA (DoxX/SURF4 family)